MASQEQATAEAQVLLRRGLLHPLGVSFLLIIEKACTRAQGVGGPIGHTTKKIARFITPAFPLLCTLQYQWLILLAFIDDHIRVFANILSNKFPASIRLINKIDMLIDTAEILPEKFDMIVNNFPLIIHKFPFLDSALATCIVWINFLLSTFTHRRISYFTKEKDIMVDIINCENFSDENSERLVQMTSPDKEVKEAKMVGFTGTKGNYRDIPEKGKREFFERRRDGATDQEILESYYSTTEEAWESEEYATESDENVVSEDPILELFDTTWHMNPAKSSPLPTGPFTFI